MLVLDALRQVDPVRQSADFGFQDMRGRCCAMGHLPLILPVEQRRLLLRASERNPKLPALVDAERSALEIAEEIGDCLVLERATLYAARGSGVRPVGEELQDADAVATSFTRAGESVTRIGEVIRAADEPRVVFDGTLDLAG